MQQILVDHISKSFGDTVIFRNTSLTIQKGTLSVLSEQTVLENQSYSK